MKYLLVIALFSFNSLISLADLGDGDGDKNWRESYGSEYSKDLFDDTNLDVVIIDPKNACRDNRVNEYFLKYHIDGKRTDNEEDVIEVSFQAGFCRNGKWLESNHLIKDFSNFTTKLEIDNLNKPISKFFLNDQLIKVILYKNQLVDKRDNQVTDENRIYSHGIDVKYNQVELLRLVEKYNLDKIKYTINIMSPSGVPLIKSHLIFVRKGLNEFKVIFN